MIAAKPWVYDRYHRVKESRQSGRIALACSLSKSFWKAKQSKMPSKKTRNGMEFKVKVDGFLFSHPKLDQNCVSQLDPNQKQNP